MMTVTQHLLQCLVSMLLFWFLAITTVKSQTCAEGTSKDFNDYRECEYETFSFDGITCDGHLSCHDTTLTDIEYAYMYCRGSGSCINLKSNPLNTNFRRLDCDGYAACANAVVNTTLLNINSMGEPGIECEGALSCANMVIWDSFGTSYMYNENNPNYTIIPTNGVRIWAHGYGSASNLNALNTEVMNAWFRGYYSFYNGQLTMADNSWFEFWGRMAGYGATIYCPFNYTCRVDCNNYATACYGLTFDCGSPELCSVRSCDESDGVWCPQGTWKNRYDLSDSNELDNYFEFFDSGMDDNYTVEYYDIDGVDIALLPNYTNFLRAKQINSNNNGIIDDINILDDIFHNSQCIKIQGELTSPDIPPSGLCDGASDCINEDIIISYAGGNDTLSEFWVNTTWKNNSILCGRGRSVFRSTNNNAIYTIDLGCEYDIAIDADNSGLNSIIYARNHYVNGEFCYYNGLNTEILSCNSQSDDDTELYCFGRQTCYGVEKIDNFESVYCIGFRTCSNVFEISNVKNIFVFGYEAFRNTNVTVKDGQNISIVIDDGAPNFYLRCESDDIDNLPYVTIYCLDTTLSCANNMITYGCNNNTVELLLYEGQQLFTRKEKKKSNNNEEEIDVVALVLGIVFGIIALVLIIICILYRDSWLWIPDYVLQVCKNIKNRQNTRDVIDNGAAYQSKWTAADYITDTTGQTPGQGGGGPPHLTPAGPHGVGTASNSQLGTDNSKNGE